MRTSTEIWFFGLSVDNENLCTFQQNRGPEVMASSFKVWPLNPHRVPFWDAQSLLQKFMAHAVTPTTALGELAAYGQK